MQLCFHTCGQPQQAQMHYGWYPQVNRIGDGKHPPH
uniref:Uncharacterized protein n=1 Tax=Parascaris equorum TaxID=6256 RepID=A0A914RIS9_PAREQ